MPIRHNTRSHDFGWEQEGETGVTIDLRYHETEKYGPSISILDENRQEAITLPAQLFRDAVQEIDRYESMMGSSNNKQNESAKHVVNMPISSGIGLPNIVNKTSDSLNQNPNIPTAVTANEEGHSQSEAATTVHDDALSYIDDTQTPLVSFIPQSESSAGQTSTESGEAHTQPQKPSVSEPNKDEILRQRGSTPEERQAKREAMRQKNEDKRLRRVDDNDSQSDG